LSVNFAIFLINNVIRKAFVGLMIAGASVASGSVPQMNVTVSDSSGNAAYKGATNANGTFATGTLKPGGYVVQFNAKAAEVKGHDYALVVSAGNKKVTAETVAGDQFAAGGVAMRINVGAGLNITGQVATGLQTMMRNGQKMVWIPKQLGSHLPAHWAEADSADAKQAMAASSLSFKNLQDKQSQGIGLH
jgi:hypothetical protein